MPSRFSNARYTKDGIVTHSSNDESSSKLGNIGSSELTGSSATAKAWQVLDGIIRVFGGSTFTLTTPTAAQLKAYYPNAAVGSTFHFGVRNDNSGTLTLAAGSGVTNSGTSTAATGVYRLWTGSFTNVTAGSEAVTLNDA